jgi:hypothetical protein
MKVIFEGSQSYQLAWDKINDVFVKRVEDITNFSWQHKIFKVKFSDTVVGMTSYGHNFVVRSKNEDPYDQCRITAHEILMSHLWSYIYYHFGKLSKKEEKKFWEINEISTVCILGLDPILNKLWTSKTKGFDPYLKNYPDLYKLKYKFKKIYLSSKNFQTYFLTAINKFPSDSSSTIY